MNSNSLRFKQFYLKKYAMSVEMFFNRYQWAWQCSLTDECFYFSRNAAMYDAEGLNPVPLVYEIPTKISPTTRFLMHRAETTALACADGLIPLYMNETRDCCGRIEFVNFYSGDIPEDEL